MFRKVVNSESPSTIIRIINFVIEVPQPSSVSALNCCSQDRTCVSIYDPSQTRTYPSMPRKECQYCPANGYHYKNLVNGDSSQTRLAIGSLLGL